jgi:hypothetical protein
VSSLSNITKSPRTRKHGNYLLRSAAYIALAAASPPQDREKQQRLSCNTIDTPSILLGQQREQDAQIEWALATMAGPKDMRGRYGGASHLLSLHQLPPCTPAVLSHPTHLLNTCWIHLTYARHTNRSIYVYSDGLGSLDFSLFLHSLKNSNLIPAPSTFLIYSSCDNQSTRARCTDWASGGYDGGDEEMCGRLIKRSSQLHWAVIKLPPRTPAVSSKLILPVILLVEPIWRNSLQRRLCPAREVLGVNHTFKHAHLTISF